MIAANMPHSVLSSAAPHDPAPQPAPTRRLAGAEWEIVEMARWDGPSSINPGSLFARITSFVVGHDTPLPLADPGLEALRCFSVRAWFWKDIRGKDLSAILDVGYSVADARRILAHVAAHRGVKLSIDHLNG